MYLNTSVDFHNNINKQQTWSDFFSKQQNQIIFGNLHTYMQLYFCGQNNLNYKVKINKFTHTTCIDLLLLAIIYTINGFDYIKTIEPKAILILFLVFFRLENSVIVMINW